MKKIYWGIAIIFAGALLATTSFFLLEKREPENKNLSEPIIKPTEDKKEMFQQISGAGEYLQKKRHLQILAATYEKIVASVPKSKEARKNLAKIYNELGNLEKENGKESEAQANFLKAKKLEP